MFYNVLLFISLAKPLQTSFLSRVKNRYEYIPQEDIINVTEELYDFDTTRQERLEAYTLKSVKTAETELDDVVYISELDKETKSTLDFNTTTTDFETSDVEVSYDYDVWPHTIPQWRQTAINTDSIDVTWKRRKTLPSHFPTKSTDVYSTEGINVTTGKRMSKSRVVPWFLHKRGSTNTTVISEGEKLTGERSYEETSASNLRVSKNVKAECYWCGLSQRGIPISPYCYAVFNSPDHSFRRHQNRYKRKCVEVKWTYKWPWDWNWSGPAWNEIWSDHFRGGCFKRFLDVGVVYTERGCRTDYGWGSGTYASSRFVHLERMLSGVEEGCIFSPHASLTPFSRAISLYARYHVCVCKKNYCNHASVRRLDSLYILMLILLNIFSLYFTKNV